MTQGNSKSDSKNDSKTAVEAVVEVARKHENASQNNILDLPSGHRVEIRAVSVALIQEVMQSIPDPLPPTFTNKETGKEEANLGSPVYYQDRLKVTRLREQASSDAMIYFGVKLLSPMPDTDEWLNEFQWYVKRMKLPFELGDLTDPINKQFLFKKYILADTDVIFHISQLSNVTEEQVASSRKTFRGDKAGVPDSGSKREGGGQPEN